MNELPPGWRAAPLSSITTDTQQHVPGAEESFTYIDIGSIDREKKTIIAPQVLLGKVAPSRARKRVASGDTLVSMTRPNLNAVALVPAALHGQIASTGFDVLRPLTGIDPRWIGYLVRTEDFVNAMSELVQGALYPAVRSKDVRNYVAPVAPSVEQSRIADQIDSLLARVNACNDHLDAIPGLLKRFRQAVLDAATAGALTEDWRETVSGAAPETVQNPWVPSSIREITVDLRYGTSKKCTYSSGGVGVLRIPNILDYGCIDLHDLKSAEFETGELQKLSLRAGDLLIIRSNGSVELVGKASVVTAKEAGLLFAGYLMRLRVDPLRALPEFVQLSLSAKAQRQYIELTAKSTSGVNNLNAEELKAIPLLLPNLDEQREIVRRVKALFHMADRIEARFTKACAYAQRLGPQVLSKAFRGELVPQDSNDEPASALLARLAAEREGSTTSVVKRPTRKNHVTRAPKESAAMNKSCQDEDVKGQPYLANHLRRLGQPVTVETLFEVAELPVADFYKQLVWEVEQGLVSDNTVTLEAGYAA